MNILLFSVVTEVGSLPVLPLGMACVAASAERAGHRVRQMCLTPAELERRLPAELSALPPDVIGLAVRNIDNQSCQQPVFFLEPVRAAVRLCRRFSPAPVVVGGAGYSIFARSALDFLEADYGVRGEGERTFPQLLERLQKRQPPDGLAGLVKRGPAGTGSARPWSSLAELPLPRPGRHLVLPPEPHADLWVPFQTRRGCAMDCSYCSTSAIEGRRLRWRPVSQVVDGLAQYVALGWRRFFFVDNCFNLPPSYALKLCRGIVAAGLDIRWHAIIYPWQVDAELVRAMAAAGCAEVSLGFESGCVSVLGRMNKRYGPRDVRRVSRLLREHGIRRLGFLMLGGPGETRATVEASLDFADELACEALKVTVGLRIYPDTPLARIARAERLVAPRDDLLRPRFFLVPELADWLPEEVTRRAAGRPHWLWTPPR
jgi:radical SAM superfamily enzyme YgiQ (UPF0313 family)